MIWEIELHESEINPSFNYYTIWLKTANEIIPVANCDKLTQIDKEIREVARKIKFDITKGIIETKF